MSTILSEKKTLSPWAKGGIGLGAGALLLVLVGLLFPTAAYWSWQPSGCSSPQGRHSSRW